MRHATLGLLDWRIGLVGCVRVLDERIKSSKVIEGGGKARRDDYLIT